ncbi:MAG: fenitrothion hydrolase, partial [Solirubrobacterales bacterium]
MSQGLNRLLRIGFPAAVAAFVAAAAGAVFPGYAEAHGLIGRGDLPLPDWLLAWGATLLLIGSFAGLVLLWREPRLEGDTWRPIVPRLSSVLRSPATSFVFGLLSVTLLIVVIYSGLQGTTAPGRNFSVTFIFVTFWLGLVLLSVIFGNVFDGLSPWRAVGR